MKILTNIRFYHLAGVAQSLFAFISYIKKRGKGIQFVGVDIIQDGERQVIDSCHPGDCRRTKVIFKHVADVSMDGLYDQFDDLNQARTYFAEIIDAYDQAIKEERPDLVLVNGTYFLPWCLLQAARLNSIPVVVHYHGLITKETEHFRGKGRAFIKLMEKDFDGANTSYIFPSELARDTVASDLDFSNLDSSLILPNPVPDHFFDAPARFYLDRMFGFVMRWAHVKNPDFVARFLKYLSRYHMNDQSRIITNLSANDKRISTFSRQHRFVKPMSSRRLPRFYNRLSAILCPSRFETYGNVAQESLATGTPAFVSPQMGVAETYRQIGLEDYIINFRSPARTYRRIIGLLKRGPIPETTRISLRNYAHSERIYGKMIEFLRMA